MKIRIVIKSKHKLQEYTTDKSAGMYMKANMENDVILMPLERAMKGTGLYLELPDGYDAQIRPCCGLTVKKSITVLKSHRTIDAEYRERSLHHAY